MFFRSAPETLNPRKRWRKLLSPGVICTGFSLNSDYSALARLFAAEPTSFRQGDQYRFRHGDDIAVVLEHSGARQIKAVRWGARSPTDEEFAWQIPTRELVHGQWACTGEAIAQRCLIPIQSFTLQSDRKNETLAARFGLVGNEPMAWAGLCQASGEEDQGCAGIMVKPNPMVGQYHGLMPLILRPHAWDLWLRAPFHEASKLLVPFDGPLTLAFVGTDEPSERGARPERPVVRVADTGPGENEPLELTSEQSILPGEAVSPGEGPDATESEAISKLRMMAARARRAQ
jgi:putative SOS response-associated peptidase YedK